MPKRHKPDSATSTANFRQLLMGKRFALAVHFIDCTSQIITQLRSIPTNALIAAPEI